MNKNIVRTKTDDCRRIETLVEECFDGVVKERVTTTKEEVVPMAVTKRVHETIAPVVTSRKVETFDQGEIVKSELESVPAEAFNLSPPRVTCRPAAAPTCCPAPRATDTTASTLPAVKHGTPAVGLDINLDLILYAAIAVEVAVILYLTVLKGWVLN